MPARPLSDWLRRLDPRWGAALAASLAVPPATRWGLLWVPLVALALASLLRLSPVQERLSRALSDLSLHAVTQPAHYDDVLVVDIDDASLRALRPRLGAWPYSLDSFALVIGYLRELGARVIAIDVVLSELRGSETALVEALAARPDVSLAGAGLKRPAPGDSPVGDAAVAALSLPNATGGAMVRWPAATLPADPLVQALARHGGFGAVGIITIPVDQDGIVRRLPLLHEVDGRVYPAMSLAALAIGAGRGAVLQASPGRLRLGPRQWPVDERGCFMPMLPPNADAVPTLDFSSLAAAALGITEGAGLREQVAGRTVFVGSSAFLSDEVTTAQRQVSGTMLIALTHAALTHGDGVDPSAPALSALLVVLALSPSLVLWWRRRPVLAHDAAAAVLAAVAVVGLALGALGALRWQAELLLPLGVILIGVLLAAMLQLHWVGLANQQLGLERTVAEAANQAKTQFLANVSHEIRTPMNALLGVADLLARTPLNAEQRRYVEVFQRSGHTLFELINDLLDLSTIEAGRLALKPQPFSLHLLLAELQALFSARAVDKGLALDWTLADGLPDQIVADRGRLAQVLTNLLGNAVKFTPQGRVALQASVDGDRLRFEVTDTGIGIEVSQQTRIFEPFTQVDASANRAHGGSGLGLSIAHSLVLQMGGSLSLDSQPGHGSRFSVELPLERAPLAPTLGGPGPGGDTAAQAGAQAAASPPPCRVLLTEDNEINVLLVQAMLEDSGCELVVAHDGEAALEIFREQAFDLVLMDIQMPGIDGLATTRAMRRMEKDLGRAPVHIVALTANAFEQDVQRSLDAGCDAHLAKPVTRETLRAVVASASRR